MARMPSFDEIRHDFEHGVQAVEEHFAHHDAAPAPSPSFTPAVQSQPSQPEVPVSIGQTIHNDVSAAGAAIQHAWQFTQQIAGNPEVDELVETALTAVGQGVAAEAFAAATDALKGAIARKAGTAGQVEAAAGAARQAVSAPQQAQAAQVQEIQ